jgi:hypothetical protein
MAKSEVEMVNAIVARGRTVVTPHPKEMVEYYRPDMLTSAMVAVRAPRQVSFGPGMPVSLSRAEYNSLLDLGFVVDPSDTVAVAAARSSAGGNTVTEDAGGHAQPGLVSSVRH